MSSSTCAPQAFIRKLQSVLPSAASAARSVGALITNAGLLHPPEAVARRTEDVFATVGGSFTLKGKERVWAREVESEDRICTTGAGIVGVTRIEAADSLDVGAGTVLGGRMVNT
jgi:hypothetical protein